MNARFAFAVAALAWTAVPVAADIVAYNSLTYNGNGQATAHFQAQNGSFFDLFVEIEDGGNNTVCTPTDPCFPNSPTSRQLPSGYFKMAFQALSNGNPLTVTGAGLNQQQTSHDSFFDVFFQVDLGGGVMQEAAIGIDMIPAPPPIVPGAVTGLGTIGWRSVPNPPPIRESTFELDPMAFETFDIVLQPNLTLPGSSPPTLTSNPNVVPEPASLLLLATVMAGLLARRRFRDSPRA